MSAQNKILISYWWVRPNGSNTYIEEYVSNEIMDTALSVDDLKPLYLKAKGLRSSDITSWNYKIISAPKFERRRDWLSEGEES